MQDHIRRYITFLPNISFKSKKLQKSNLRSFLVLVWCTEKVIFFYFFCSFLKNGRKPEIIITQLHFRLFLILLYLL